MGQLLEQINGTILETNSWDNVQDNSWDSSWQTNMSKSKNESYFGIILTKNNLYTMAREQ